MYSRGAKIITAHFPGMENYAIDDALVEADKEISDKRHNYSQEAIKAITDLARHHGAGGAVRLYAQAHPREDAIPRKTAENWLKHYQSSTPHSYFVPKKRGRPELLTPTEKSGLLKGIDLLRSASFSPIFPWNIPKGRFRNSF